MTLLERPEARLAIALGTGLLLGAERERHLAEQPRPGAAGLRTFALVALLGGVMVRLGGWVPLLVGGLFVSLAALSGYAAEAREDPGITTEVSLMLTYGIGALALHEPLLAAAIAVTSTWVLAESKPLHRLVREGLSREELLDALVFGAAALIVLPLVPNAPIGPYRVLNPFAAWKLVVTVMGVTGAGYVAQRLLGPRYGLPVAGLASGFVSSPATIAAMGERARRDPSSRGACIAAAAASSVATIAELALLVGTVHRGTLYALAPALSLAGLTALAYAATFTWRAARDTRGAPQRGRAFRMRTAILFAAALTFITIVSSFLVHRLGDAGLVLGASFAGFADTHAMSASVASLVAAHKIDTKSAEVAVLACLSTNSVTKVAIAFGTGERRYACWVAAGVVAVLAAAWAGFIVGR